MNSILLGTVFLWAAALCFASSYLSVPNVFSANYSAFSHHVHLAAEKVEMSQRDFKLEFGSEWTSRKSIKEPYELELSHYSRRKYEQLAKFMKCANFKCDLGYSAQTFKKKVNLTHVAADCLTADLLCNGMYDCVGGTDETRGVCDHVGGSFMDYNTYFDVDNADSDSTLDAYVDLYLTQYDDDYDFKKAENCNHKCFDGYVRVLDHRFGCLPDENVCDGVIDCTDASDETRELCLTKNCPEGSFKCETRVLTHPSMGSMVLPKKTFVCARDKKKCDGHQDCDDGSDEKGCSQG